MIEEMRGYFVRTRHDEECDGWILHGFRTMREGGSPDKGRPDYRPCEMCSPGQYAVWKAGLMLPKIDLSPELQSEARDIYIGAEMAAGNSKRAKHIEEKVKDAGKKSRRSKESEDSWV